jgi:hypothetical protein
MPAERASNNRSASSAVAAVALLIIGVMAFVPAAWAEFYSWTDEAGNMHFTDRPETIPKKYQDRIEVQDDENSRTWEYLASEYGVDYYYDTSNVSYTNRNRFRVMIKESYAAAGREEYETQVIMGCARLMYKPTQSVRIYKKQRSPVDVRYGGEDGSYGSRDGYQRLTHPYQVLSRMICRSPDRDRQ